MARSPTLEGPSSRPTGAARFRVKGIAYTNACTFYEEKLRGGVTALVRSLESVELRDFLNRAFEPDGWYDVFPMVPISAAAARLRGQAHAKLLRENAAWAAIRDLHGPYQGLMSLGSIEQVVERLPKMSMDYFDFGSAEGRLVRANVFEAHRHGVPESLSSWLGYGVEGFVPVALTLAGAKEVRVRSLASRPGGIVHGMQTVSVRCEIVWR